MRTKIIFSADSSPLYDPNADFEWNLEFIHNRFSNLFDECHYKGYLYLHEIFEKLGVSWKPYLKDKRRKGNFISADDPIVIESWPDFKTGDQIHIVINTGKDAEKLIEQHELERKERRNEIF